MRPHRRPETLAAVLAVAALAVMGPVSQARSEGGTSFMAATVRLATDRTAFPAGGPVMVNVTIANPGKQRIALLRWRTPLGGVEAPLFSVTRDGSPVRYLGRMIKRTAPNEADYVTFEAGESVTTEVDIAKFYALDTPGHYVVAYDVASPQLYPPGHNVSLTDGHLSSEPLTIVVEGGAAAPRS
ncbi:MAG: hypothetical protein WCH13_16680 [Deltaproteobacteria bacterium]